MNRRRWLWRRWWGTYALVTHELGQHHVTPDCRECRRLMRWDLAIPT